MADDSALGTSTAESEAGEPTVSTIPPPTFLEFSEAVEPIVSEALAPTASEALESPVLEDAEPPVSEQVHPTVSETLEPTFSEAVAPAVSEGVEPLVAEAVEVTGTPAPTPHPEEAVSAEDDAAAAVVDVTGHTTVLDTSPHSGIDLGEALQDSSEVEAFFTDSIL